MAVVTVPGGSGTTVSLTFNTQSNATIAQNLLSQALASGASDYIINSGTTGAVTVPSGVSVVIDASTAVTSISFASSSFSGELVEVTSVGSGTAGLSIFGNAGSGTILGGGGAVTVASAATVGSGFITGGDATYSSFFTVGSLGGSGGVGVVGSGGSVSVSGGGNTVFATAGGSVTVTGSANTVVSGTGSSTISASSSGGLYFNGSGSLNFVDNNGNNTVVSGGAATVFSGGANTASLYFSFGTSTFNYTNTGGNDTVAGLGNTVSVTGSAGGVTTLLTTANSPTATITAGGGTETFLGNFLFGPAVFVGSTGTSASTTITMGNSGSETVLAGAGTGVFIAGTTSATDLFSFVKGSTGASANDTIFNFSTLSDSLSLSGLTVSSTVVGGGGVQLTLSDSTKVTLVGMSSLTGVNIKTS